MRDRERINLKDEIDLCRAYLRAEHVGWASVLFHFFFFFLKSTFFIIIIIIPISPSFFSFQTVIIAPGRMLSGIFRKPQFFDIVRSGMKKIL